jgi:hypothetical protein
MTTRTKPAERSAPGADNLDARYGAIGISAVAAAVRYQGESKNPDRKSSEPNGAASNRKSELAA